MKLIPHVGDTSAYRQVITLEDSVYIFRTYYNTRDKAWYLDLLEQDETPIIYGLKLVINWGLLARYQDDRLPPGELITVDLAGDSNEVDRDNFGDTVRLVYISEAELDALV